MKLPVSSVPKTKIGMCPHGLPQGACPICSGMGGGGGSVKKADNKPKEMSWDECYAVWQQMVKAKEHAQQRKNEAIQAQMISQYKTQISIGAFAQKMVVLADKLSVFTQKAQSNPTLASKLLAFPAKLTLVVVNGLKNALVLADKALNVIKEKLTDISDKLSAIFGELKNSNEKKISERLKDFKKKIKSLFGIFEPAETDDDEQKIEEAKRVFDLKTAFNTIKENFSKKHKEEELTDDN